jgi:methylmalonyl-CoA carboxyltransferase large subunit
MESKTIDATQIIEAVDSLRQDVARLHERIAAIEQVLPAKVSDAAQHSREMSGAEGLSEAVVLAVSAAVAAYLGVQPRIRQIRLLRNDSWALQGRATIQASHALTVRH